MSAVTITPDMLLALAMSDRTNAMARLVLLTAERADRHGVAKFDSGELLDLINDGRAHRLDNPKLWGLLRRAMNEGFLAEGSRTTRTRLPEGITVQSAGLIVVKVLDNKRALAECGDCGHRAVFATEWLADNAATCPRCRQREQRSAA